VIEIRSARWEDIPEMRQVAITTYQDTFADANTPENMQAYFNEAYSLEVLLKELEETRAKLFIAWEDDKVVGFARLRVSDEVVGLLGSNTIELQRLYVLTSAQGQSVGKLLMQHSLEYAQSHQYDWIWLGVWEKNFKAQQFYNKWGFQKFSEHTFWMGEDPQIDWLLKKKL
jgi:diamine N-acetyltransferase